MKAKIFRIITILAILALTFLTPPVHGGMVNGPAPARATLAIAPQSTTVLQAKVTEALRSSPVMFIQNVGQFDERALFQVWGSDKTIWLAEDGIWVTVLEKPSKPKEPLDSHKFGKEAWAEEQPRKAVNIKLSFLGSNPHPYIEPFDRLDMVVSYFIGNDPAKWLSNVPVWSGARYKDLYSGIDLEITGEGGQLVQRLVAKPGADLSTVRLRVEGADAVALLPGGEGLRLTTAVGEFTLPLLRVEGSEGWSRPSVVVQAVAEQAFEVAAPFASLNPNLQSSGLLYATFLGGSKRDWGWDIAVDSLGNAYVTGWTESFDFPAVPGAYDPTYNGNEDVFVVKLNTYRGELAYATFLGGSGWDGGRGIAVDSSGAAYVTGSTESSDFPTTPGAYDRTHNGSSDAFVVKLNPSGSALTYATFLGGNNGDMGYDIAVDSSGAAYIVGATWSSDFPTFIGPDLTHNGPTDGFVAKLNPSGTGLIYAGFVGGSGWDSCEGIALDAATNAYVTGITGLGGHYPSHNDAFIAKVKADGTAFLYNIPLGGSNYDKGNDIAVDSSGAAYVIGETWSSDFPTTPGAFDTTYNGGRDAFVAKLNPSGNGLTYATFLGGGGDDAGLGIAVDLSGAAYVTGLTHSFDFPTTLGAFNHNYNGRGDAFVAKLDPFMGRLVYASFLGGSDTDEGFGIAVDSKGAVYVTGNTFSSDFPTTPGAFDTTFNGGYYDTFVMKLRMGGEVGPTPTRIPIHTPTPVRTPIRTPTPTRTPTRTPTFTKPAPTATLPTFPTIPSGGLWIEDLKVTYSGPYPSRAYVTVINRSSERRSAELVLKWEGKGTIGVVGRKRVDLGPGKSASVEFDLSLLSPKAELLRAEIDGHSYQTYLKTPPYPPSDEFSFLLYPSPENATELRIITPEGYVYTFPVKKVKISLDKSQVPTGFQWEKVNLYFFSRVSLEKCAIHAFLPWWIKIFQEDPAKVIAGEIVVKLVEEAAKELGAGSIPVGKLLNVAETIKCAKEGILVPLATDEPYLIIGKAVHLKVEYMAGTFTTTYAWEGRGEWSGYVNEATTQIRIPITPYSYNPITEAVKDMLCPLRPNLPFCATTKCEQVTHNGLCYWEGFYVLNNQWGANQRPDCVKAGSYQRISTTGIEVVMDYDWANIKRRGCEAQVKGYPAIIAGWHYGEAIPEYPGGYLTPMGIHGLPAQIKERNQFPSSFLAFREGPAGIINLSWGIWIASEPQPQKPKAKIMVWPWYAKQQPLTDKGGRLKTVTIGGMKWDLYRGKTPDGWWVYTFKPSKGLAGALVEAFTGPIPWARVESRVNLGEFVQYLVQEGHLSDQDWIVGIEFGSEIIEGKGRWRISKYLLEPGGSLP